MKMIGTCRAMSFLTGMALLEAHTLQASGDDAKIISENIEVILRAYQSSLAPEKNRVPAVYNLVFVSRAIGADDRRP